MTFLLFMWGSWKCFKNIRKILSLWLWQYLISICQKYYLTQFNSSQVVQHKWPLADSFCFQLFGPKPQRLDAVFHVYKVVLVWLVFLDVIVVSSPRLTTVTRLFYVAELIRVHSSFWPPSYLNNCRVSKHKSIKFCYSVFCFMHSLFYVGVTKAFWVEFSKRLELVSIQYQVQYCRYAIIVFVKFLKPHREVVGPLQSSQWFILMYPWHHQWKITK